MMRSQQIHQDIFTKVTMYLDNEMTKDAEKALLSEIHQNPSFHQVLDQEKTFRAFIKDKMPRRKVSPTLIKSIKDKIRITAPPV